MCSSFRWADMFSAPGCHGTKDHTFSHPFVQVMTFSYPYQDNNTLFTSKFPSEHVFSVAQQRTEVLSYALAKWELISNLPSSYLSFSRPSRLWECFWESCPAWWCSTFYFVMIGADPSPPWNQARVSTPYFSSPLLFVTCWEHPSCMLVSVNHLSLQFELDSVQ